MKKLLLLVIAMLILTGCTSQTFETVDDLNDVSAMANPATLLLDLPEQATAHAMQCTSGTLYFCSDYDIALEIMPSGNLSGTLQTLTGFPREKLELIQTVRCGANCYEGAWTAAGEANDQVGRVLVLDDGSYHYCVCIMTSAENAGDCAAAWKEILDSVALTES